MSLCFLCVDMIWRVTPCLLSYSLKTFFNKARDMVYFKRLIQIPKLPDVRAQRAGTWWDGFSAESQPSAILNIKDYTIGLC